MKQAVLRYEPTTNSDEGNRNGLASRTEIGVQQHHRSLVLREDVEICLVSLVQSCELGQGSTFIDRLRVDS